jgi:hypothetical protein
VDVICSPNFPQTSERTRAGSCTTLSASRTETNSHASVRSAKLSDSLCPILCPTHRSIGVIREQPSASGRMQESVLPQGFQCYPALSAGTYDFSSFTLGVRVVAGSNPAAPTNQFRYGHKDFSPIPPPTRLWGSSQAHRRCFGLESGLCRRRREQHQEKQQQSQMSGGASTRPAAARSSRGFYGQANPPGVVTAPQSITFPQPSNWLLMLSSA